MKYRREIDGLRAVAVLPVILFHAGFSAFSGGFIGVDVFFVISGYLITTIILADKEKGTFSLVTFYERRARRILPALFFVMFCCIPFAWFWLLPNHLKDFSESLVAVSVFSSNILFWSESGYFGTASELKPLLHTWSLAVEEQYYVLFPLFMMFMWKFRKRWIFGSLMVIAVASLAVAQWGAHNKPAATFFLLPARGWELAIGALIAFYFLYKKDHAIFVTSNKAISEFFGFVGISLIGYSIFAFDNSTPFPGFYALIPTIGTGLIIVFTTPQTLVGRFLGTKAMVGIGLISYSTYLWHQPLFVFARHRSLTEPSVSLLLMLSVSSIVMAYFSWRYVEMPFRDKKKINRNRIFSFVLVGSLSFIAIGSAGHFEFAFQKKDPQLLVEAKVLRKERRQLIRIDDCHYNIDRGVDIDTFLDKWNCYDDELSLNYKKIPFVVTGDSHSADKVNALKQKGLLPLQIGGAGCSLVPSFMSTDCKKIFKKLGVLLSENSDIKYIALANRFNKRELTLEKMKETIDFWESFGRKLLVFSPMPVFKPYDTRLFYKDYSKPDMELSKIFYGSELSDFLNDRNVSIISTEDMFCQDGDCSMVKGGRLLLTDETHLSKYGAVNFGDKLVESTLFRHYYTDVSRASVVGKDNNTINLGYSSGYKSN